MPNFPLSVRLPTRLATALGWISEYLDLSPSQLVEMLLRGSGAYQEELLKTPVQGPFTEKRNLRLRPETIQQLRQLTRYRHVPSAGSVYDIEPSVYIRSMLAYFFSKPQAFQSVVPNAPRAEEWARILEEEERILRRTRTTRVARPAHPRVGMLILLLPLLILLIIGIMDLFNDSPLHEPPRPPRPPAPPKDSEERLAEDTGYQSNQSSKEGK